MFWRNFFSFYASCRLSQSLFKHICAINLLMKCLHLQLFCSFFFFHRCENGFNVHFYLTVQWFMLLHFHSKSPLLCAIGHSHYRSFMCPLSFLFWSFPPSVFLQFSSNLLYSTRSCLLLLLTLSVLQSALWSSFNKSWNVSSSAWSGLELYSAPSPFQVERTLVRWPVWETDRDHSQSFFRGNSPLSLLFFLSPSIFVPAFFTTACSFSAAFYSVHRSQSPSPPSL